MHAPSKLDSVSPLRAAVSAVASSIFPQPSRPGQRSLTFPVVGATVLAAAIVNRIYRKSYSSTEHEKRKSSENGASSSASSSTENLASTKLPRTSSFAALKDFASGLTKERVMVVVPTKPTVFDKHYPRFPPAVSGQKVAVNKEFFRQLKALFLILVPNLRSKEMFILLLNSCFLVLRTYLSIVVARVDGRIVRDLVAANGPAFLKGLAYWFAIAVPATYTNSMIRYLQSKLSIGFRTRLTRYVHDIYLDEMKTYYKVINLDGRIEGADQFITTDIARFCDTLSSLYSNMGKPVLDTIIFNYQLTQSIGLSGMLGLLANYVVTASIMRAVTPAFGRMAATEAKLEGDYRAAHSRLITNAEEVAFYNGSELEKSILDRAFTRLIHHVNGIFKIRIAYNMFEDFVIKYCWSAVGLGVCAVPVFFPEWAGKGGKEELAAIAELQKEGGNPLDSAARAGSRTQGFITNKRLMISLADAGGRIMYSYKELAELAGHTSRVYTLISVLHQLHHGNYTSSAVRPVDSEKPFYTLTDIRGLVEFGYNGIRMNGVPIVTPSPVAATGGEELVKDLNLDVTPGEHLLITGPNGVGKTSVSRVVSGLWPCFRGKLERPSPGDIFYIPQRPYLSIGTLRDQIIYPHTHANMIAAGRTDDELMKILRLVHLAYIPEREGGWETKKEWKDVFSGGEKQRVGMARLFYHAPKYAMLDECTSAVSADVEGLMYNEAKEMGITLITISHRPSLYKYHKFLLSLTGDHGTWELTKIGADEESISREKEIARLQQRLADVDSLRRRVEQINQELQLSKESGIHAGEVGRGGR